MVHALDEIRRVLTPDGILIDLRPLCDRWPVEVAWSGGYQEAGRVTDLPESLADDAAANAVMTAGETTGLHRDRDETFPFFYYWDTAREMQDYIAENWDDVVEVDEAVWSSLRSIWATSNADARVRLRMKMLIARYRLQK
jgi:SAM-dependent methyltransferase